MIVQIACVSSHITFMTSKLTFMQKMVFVIKNEV